LAVLHLHFLSRGGGLGVGLGNIFWTLSMTPWMPVIPMQAISLCPVVSRRARFSGSWLELGLALSPGCAQDFSLGPNIIVIFRSILWQDCYNIMDFVLFYVIDHILPLKSLKEFLIMTLKCDGGGVASGSGSSSSSGSNGVVLNYRRISTQISSMTCGQND